MQTPLQVFRCPSDVGPGLNDRRTYDTFDNRLATSNYVASGGNSGDGAFDWWHKCRRTRDFTDGTSNSFLLGERAYGDIAGTGDSCASVWSGIFEAWSHITQRCELDMQAAVFLTRWRMQSGQLVWGNLVIPSSTASSEHTGGAHFAMADGSVQFVSENIESRWEGSSPYQWGVYQRLGAIKDGYPVGEF